MKTEHHNDKFIYECSSCKRNYTSQTVIYLCVECSKKNRPDLPPFGVLSVRYDYGHLKKNAKAYHNLHRQNFIDLLPIKSYSSMPKLRVSNTPLYNISVIDKQKLDFQLFIKDDSQQPTFSFKDRASALVSAFAKERGISTIVAASTGNAGSSLAGICASQKQRAIIIVPAKAPIAKLTQILMYGASIVPVQGTYDDAFDLSVKATETFGWYSRNTAYNPLTIEGKKTVSLELFAQMKYQVPDRVFVPTGDGVILAGVYKGFEDLLQLGFIHQMPVVVAVQSEGSNNLIRNLETDVFEIRKSETIADSISVDIPRNFYLAKHYLKTYSGESISVPDRDIIAASGILARNTGIFTEPAGATAFAGMLAYHRLNKIPNTTKNVVLLTGSGLKDLKAVDSLLHLPHPIEPTIENLQKIIR